MNRWMIAAFVKHARTCGNCRDTPWPCNEGRDIIARHCRK